MTTITSVPFISHHMVLDMPVQPMTARQAQKMTESKQDSITIFTSPGCYVLARKIPRKPGEPFQTFQVWGKAGTYAHGTY